MLKRILIVVGGLVGLVIVAAIAVPLFVDVNNYKPTIAAEVKKATGRDLVIDGKIGLSLLPTPSISVEGVRFSNVPGSKSANMVELKSVTVKPSLFALIGGKIEVSEVTLVEPKIVLEIDAKGKPNWEFAPAAAPTPTAPQAGGAPGPMSLGRLAIDNGSLSFVDAKGGLSVKAEKIDLTASVGSLEGPYALKGSLSVNGSPLKLDLAIGAKGATGLPANISLEANGGKLSFNGSLSELGPKARVGGTASVSADSLATFVASLAGMAGQPAPALPPPLAGKFSFDGGIEASQDAVAAKDFKLAVADSAGSGSIAIKLKPAIAIDGKIVVPKLDLDKVIAGLSSAAPAPAPPPPASGSPPAAASGGAIPTDLSAKFALEMGEVIYNKAPVRNVAVELEVRGGAVAVPRLTATLPGDLVLQAKSTMSGNAAKPTVAGDFNFSGAKLRETLAWLAVDVSAVPASKLNKLSFKGKLTSTEGKVQVADAAFELDDLKGSGGLDVTLGVPLTIVARVDLDTLDADSFMGPAPATGAAKSAPPPAKPPAAAPSGAAVSGPTVGLKLKLAKLIFNKETAGGIEIDIAMMGSQLKFNDIKVSNLAGARFALRGSVSDYSSSSPRADVAFNFEAPDLARVVKLATGSAPAGLGAASASGGIAGSAESLTLRDLSVSAMGYTVKATGTVAVPGASSGPPQSVVYKGSITVNGQTIEGTVDAKLAGKPNVTAVLHAASLDVEKLTGGGGARGGQPAAGGSAKPIDTSPLRSVDANVKFTAGTLAMSPSMRISNADVAAVLKDGVLTISQLKGGLFGGTLAFSGVVNGSQPALSLDIKGDVNGIYLGEMMRSTSGSNQFGSTVKVTLDGKLNASNIVVKGGGATADQIKASMAGGADLGGHVFVGADKTLTTIGSAATGAAGGVIDSTVGNALGAVGQHGGVGVGNMLNAISLVLNRFVNHDNPISGHIDIVNGVLTDKALAVTGNKATANISTKTNLVAQATDTTINFVIAEDPSAPYLVTTARGPTSNLSYNVTRGTAKDPPGMASTLGGATSGGQPGGGILPKVVPGGGQGGGASPIPSIPKIFGR